eukprot:scaffold1515_cov162-Amphora_coffeaeformis.AAC.7
MDDNFNFQQEPPPEEKVAPTTRVNGVGLWNSWTRNFKTPLLAFLDLMDNAVDSADVSSHTGKIHIDRDQGTSLCPTGIMMMNNSQEPIKDLGQILEVYHSTKQHNAESVGENGVGLKQGCAALANLNFVVVRHFDDLWLGIISRRLQTPEGICLPHYHLGNIKSSSSALSMVRALCAQEEAVSLCLMIYGGGNLETGIQRFVLKIEHMLKDPVWANEPHVFMLVINQLVHAQNHQLKEEESAHTTRSHPGAPPADNFTSPDAAYVHDFLKELAEALPRQYIHIPSSFHLKVCGRPLQFEYWPRRLVEMSHFSLPIVTNQLYLKDKDWRETSHRDEKHWYYLNVYLGFDAHRVREKNNTVAQLFVYSRASGRLISCIDDARSMLMLTVGSSNFCQGLTIIVDDIGGKLPLNPTKQDLAFGEEEYGETHKKNMFAWLGGVAWMYWQLAFDACGSKDILTKRVQEAYIDSATKLSVTPPPIHQSEFTCYKPPCGNKSSWIIKYQSRILPSKREEFIMLPGKHTLFRIQRDRPSPSAKSPKKQPAKKRRLESESIGGTNTTELLSQMTYGYDEPQSTFGAAVAAVGRGRPAAGVAHGRAGSVGTDGRAGSARSSARGRAAAAVGHAVVDVDALPSPVAPPGWEQERTQLESELAKVKDELAEVKEALLRAQEHGTNYKKHYNMEKTERKALQAQNAALQTQNDSLRQQLDLAKSREAPTSPLPSDEECVSLTVTISSYTHAIFRVHHHHHSCCFLFTSITAARKKQLSTTRFFSLQPVPYPHDIFCRTANKMRGGRVRLSTFCRRSSYARCVSIANEVARFTGLQDSSGSITATTIRAFSTRHEFEEAFHLGRACSKFNMITDDKIQKWKKKLGKVPPLKLVVPDDVLTPQPRYEVDALAEIHERSYECNVLLEIRDVRVPASSHHPSFTRLAEHRLHLICYTHADMIDAATRDRVEAWTTKSWPKSRCIFVDTREARAFVEKEKKKDEIKKNDQGEKSEETGEADKKEVDNDEEGGDPPASPYDMLYDSLLHHLETKGGVNTALTVGVANTGKSSLLMALLRTARMRGDIPKKGLKTANVQMKKTGKKKKNVSRYKGQVEIQDKPGKTREITEYLLREKPRAFFLDVPGMTPPPFFFLERPEAWFAFGAANLLPQSKSVEKDVQVQSAYCNYVLYAMNRDANFGYVAKLGLAGPTLDIQTVLDAAKGNERIKDPEALRLSQCKVFLKLFNTGNFGPVILDDLSKPYKRFVFKDSHFKRKIFQKRRRGFDSDDEDYSDIEIGNEGVDDDDDDDEDGFYKSKR